MKFVVSFLGTQYRRWHRVSLARQYVGGAIVLSLLTVICASLVASLVSGPMVYLYPGLLSTILFVASAYVSGRRTDSLLALSLRDPLTGIGNRRALRIHLKKERARCSRANTPLSLLMIDVDKLKEINDTEGHRAGDEALRAFARTLCRVTRISDSVGRLGGDEFLVIAPDTREADALALAERIAADALRSGTWQTEGIHGIGLSIGISTTTAANFEIEALIEAADEAMYDAKQRGGRRIAVASAKQSAGVLPLRSA